SDRMMAEVLGKEAGYNKGRGGTMHIVDLSLGILGANGIVAGGLGIVAGAGWSAKQLKNGRVAVVFYGDGASNAGVVPESMNLSKIWNLPVIYVCENNQYGQFTARSKVAAGPRLGARAESYGLRATELDGQDVLGVYDAMCKVVDRVRNGGGPEFVECKTYRWGGHHVGDPGKAYRPAEEIEDWKTNRDPLKLFADKVTRDKLCTPEEIEAVNQEIQKEIDDAVEFAKTTPFPNVSEVSRYVYP
ncbi:MAG TPA: thiamine pyrophosphate-dependent dehydrogenase E1 component subunit alpha, partial [Chloroflexota bacterium]|nr:thiamine pyrophosphate-dependent dehydrogenase E1 component subunit alpha [Chloroflexota bacterium]